jgi:hypothetical protein
MRKARLIVACLALAVALLSTLGCDNRTPAKIESDSDGTVTPTPEETNPGTEKPVNHKPGESNFNLIFRYGIMAGNTLNTFEGTYTKDMVRDPSITVPLALTEEETDRIYHKMVEIDFFNYPDNFSVSVPPGQPVGMRTPYSSYYFKVEYKSRIKELWWEDEIVNADEKANRLRELIRLIRDIIKSKEEYKELPEPRSAYL